MFGLFKVANVILRGRRGVLIWKCQKPVSLARAAPDPILSLFPRLSLCQAAPSRVGLGAGAQL